MMRTRWRFPRKIAFALEPVMGVITGVGMVTSVPHVKIVALFTIKLLVNDFIITKIQLFPMFLSRFIPIWL